MCLENLFADDWRWLGGCYRVGGGLGGGGVGGVSGLFPRFWLQLRWAGARSYSLPHSLGAMWSASNGSPYRGPPPHRWHTPAVSLMCLAILR